MIATCVDLVLSRPPQVGGAEIESLVGTRLPHVNFFGIGDRQAIRATVAEEIGRFRSNALKGIAERLADSISTEKPGSTLHKNAVLFLGGMASTDANPEARRCAWAAVGRLLTSAGSASVLPILRDNPSGLGAVEEVVRFRALGLVKAYLKEPDAQTTLSAWLKTGVLTDEEKRDFLARLETGFLHFGYSTSAQRCRETVSVAAALNLFVDWPEFRNVYIEWLLTSLTHGDFHVENAAIEHVRDLTATEAGYFSEEMKARAVMGIIEAAGHGANSGKGVCENGLSNHPDFVDAFIAALTSGQIEFSAYEWKWAEKLLAKTLTLTAATNVARDLAAGTIRATRTASVLSWMRMSSTPEIKAFAVESQLPVD